MTLSSLSWNQVRALTELYMNNTHLDGTIWPESIFKHLAYALVLSDNVDFVWSVSWWDCYHGNESALSPVLMDSLEAGQKAWHALILALAL